MKKVLLVIDIQNDYFADGAYPLWNAEETLTRVESAVRRAVATHVPVVLIRHVADTTQGPAPFFAPESPGAEIHPRILAAAPQAPVIVKSFADGFVGTALEETLSQLGATELLVCGMMTQNCVTHTAISKSAEKYDVTVLVDCCTTVTELLHLLALHALSTRTRLGPAAEALAN